MKKYWLAVMTAVTLVASPVTFAQLNAVACEPEWGALLQELGGDKVAVYNATTAFQDPHHIQARPGLIAREQCRHTGMHWRRT